MNRQVYINLPVKDLTQSKDFFAQLGFGFKTQFTNELAACVIVSDDIYVMLLTHDHMRQFTTKPIADATTATEVISCFSCDSRASVDEIVAKAVAAGATTPKPAMDHGFMYGHGFADLDGHLWEWIWMDPNQA